MVTNTADADARGQRGVAPAVGEGDQGGGGGEDGRGGWGADVDGGALGERPHELGGFGPQACVPGLRGGMYFSP